MEIQLPYGPVDVLALAVVTVPVATTRFLFFKSNVALTAPYDEVDRKRSVHPSMGCAHTRNGEQTPTHTRNAPRVMATTQSRRHHISPWG